MRSRTIAILGSIGVLSFAAAPLAQAATAQHQRSPVVSKLDRSRDGSGDHGDKSRDNPRDQHSRDSSRDKNSRDQHDS